MKREEDPEEKNEGADFELARATCGHHDDSGEAD